MAYICSNAQEVLISPGGYLDGVMYLRRDNMLNLISKQYVCFWVFLINQKKVKNISWNGIKVIKQNLSFLLLYCDKNSTSSMISMFCLIKELHDCHVNYDLNCFNMNI